MKVLRVILGILLISLIIIQFFPTTDNISNEVPTTDVIQHRQAPSHVTTLIQNACYDCHSNNTQYPWYDRIQPFSWIFEKNIKDAKRALNFNEFETYSRKKQKEKFQKIIEMIEENEMPLTSYKILHSEGRLTKAEKKQITDWVEEELKGY
ncbi:MAG TPA: heme-binding domain-containing protein [Flavobacteriaceae bacterium]|nr:heme-binding domain-containing protein [Flavobacteriaceae bacterium]